MTRKITIRACMAFLCVMVLAAWVYHQRPWQLGRPMADSDPKDDQARNDQPGPDEKKVMPSRVFDLPVRLVFFDDDQFSPCYFDKENMTLHRWKGVVLRREQLPDIGVMSSRIRTLDAKDFTVLPVEALVKYRKTDGGYRPGYLDRSMRVFYEWNDVVLRKHEVPEKSQDGRITVLAPDAFSEAIAIDMPAYLRERPEVWKKI